MPGNCRLAFTQCQRYLGIQKNTTENRKYLKYVTCVRHKICVDWRQLRYKHFTMRRMCGKLTTMLLNLIRDVLKINFYLYQHRNRVSRLKCLSGVASSYKQNSQQHQQIAGGRNITFRRVGGITYRPAMHRSPYTELF